MKRSVLITGVTGMLGLQAARQLRERGYLVFGCSRDPLKADDVTWLPVSCDLQDGEALLKAVRMCRPDSVLHLAALQASASSSPETMDLYQTNVAGTLHLLEALRQEAPATRLVVAGSGTEYGPGSSPRHRCLELDPLRPNSPYALSKAAASTAALAYNRAYGLNVVIMRIFNVVGPSTAALSAPAWFARQLAEMEAGFREPILCCGNLDAVRDFLDYRDVITALCTALENPLPAREYNVCSGRGTRLGDVVRLLLKQCRAGRVNVHRAPAPTEYDRLVGNPERLLSDMNFAPRWPLDQALAHLLSHERKRIGLSG